MTKQQNTMLPSTNHPFRFMAIALFPAMVLISGCSDDDAEPVNEEELITTVKVSFQKLDETGAPDGSPLIYSWFDEDGAGPSDPEITPIILEENATYEMELFLLDESKTPAHDITVEIDTEAEEHQFFFEVTGAALDIEYSDEDANGNPLGLFNVATTGVAGTGSIKITLLHEPDKDAAGVDQGNPDNAGGDTDVEITMPVEITD